MPERPHSVTCLMVTVLSTVFFSRYTIPCNNIRLQHSLCGYILPMNASNVTALISQTDQEHKHIFSCKTKWNVSQGTHMTCTITNEAVPLFVAVGVHKTLRVTNIIYFLAYGILLSLIEDPVFFPPSFTVC